MTVPFEQRVYPAMQSGWPHKATLIGFCPSSKMTPALVERLVLETEDAIGEPIRHTIRKVFPKLLDRSIADGSAGRPEIRHCDCRESVSLLAGFSERHVPARTGRCDAQSGRNNADIRTGVSEG